MQVQAEKAKKPLVYFGESTSNQAPYFDLAQALGAWSKPKNFVEPKPRDIEAEDVPQRDLFEMH